MRFERIDAVKYGPFTSCGFKLPPRVPDFYVFYGDNEAGKSSLLRGIKGLLFGFGSRTQDDFLHPATTLRIGGLISNGNLLLDFRRGKGNKATLMDPAEIPLADDALSKYLRGIDGERFENFYGLTHQMLVQGGKSLLEGKGDVGAALFEVSGLLGLRQMLADLEERANKVFAPRASSKLLNQALAKYAELKSKPRQLSVSREEVDRLYTELQAAKSSLESRKKESASVHETRIKLARIKANKPDLAKLAQIQKELQELNTVPDLDEKAMETRRKAQEDIQAANQEISILEETIQEREHQNSTLEDHPGLKPYEDTIGDLNQRTGRYRKDHQDLITRKRDSEAALRHANNSWRKVLPNRPIEDAEDLRLSEAEKHTLSKLIKEHGVIEDRWQKSSDDLKQLIKDQENASRELNEIGIAPDSAQLLAALTSARALGNVEAEREKLERQSKDALVAAESACSKLLMWDQGLAELNNLGIPLSSALQRYRAEWSDLANEENRFAGDARHSIEAIRDLQRKLDALQNEKSVPSGADLRTARSERDRRWQIIKAFAFDGQLTLEQAREQAGGRDPLPSQFEASLSITDSISDRRFSDAIFASQQETLSRDLDEQKLRSAALAREIASVETRRDALRQQWAAEWPDVRFLERTPDEISEWLKERDTVLETFKTSKERERDANALNLLILQKREEISSRLTELGAAPCRENESLSALLIRAEKLADEIGRQSQERKILQQKLTTLTARRGQFENRIVEYEQQRSAWDDKWNVAAGKLRACIDPDCAIVEILIPALDEVFTNLEKHASEEHRVVTISQDIDAFKSAVADLVRATDPSITSLQPDVAVAELSRRLNKMRDAEARRSQNDKEIRRDKENIEKLQGKSALAELKMASLRQEAKCSTDLELQHVLEASKRKKKLLEADAELQLNLIQRNSMDVLAIVGEAEPYSIDELQLETDRLHQRTSDISNEIATFSRNVVQLESTLGGFENSDGAADASQKLEDTMAEIRQLRDDFIPLQLSVEIIKQAMDSFREKHQGPILRRAGEIFQSLTLGEHRELSTDFNDKDEPIIVSIRKNGDKVPVEGLSEGTRDQLFLALRIAAIEVHSATAQPMPVILDDILVNSDDSRAEATLAQLRELADKTQVLFFTHHRRLADFAQKHGAARLEVARSVGIGA